MTDKEILDKTRAALDEVKNLPPADSPLKIAAVVWNHLAIDDPDVLERWFVDLRNKVINRTDAHG